MGSGNGRPRTIVVRSRTGAAYEVDLDECWQALARRQVEGQGFDSMSELAGRAGTCRATVSGFLNGRRGPSIPTARRIVAALGLDFASIARLAE